MLKIIQHKRINGVSVSAGKFNRIKVKAGISIVSNKVNWRSNNMQCPKCFRMLEE